MNILRSHKLEKFFSSEARKQAFRHALLMQEIEQLPPGTRISEAKKKEIEVLEAKFQQRLHRSLISDVLPVIKTSSKEEKQ